MQYSPIRLFNSLGKYRTLIGAVALFVLLDLLVLAMNFVIASGLSENAVAVNLAGRQRMLSQRITKTTLQIANAVQQGRDATALMTELDAARALFDTTLHAFDEGGITFDGSMQVTQLDAAKGGARRHVEQANELWQPINLALLKLTQSPAGALPLPLISQARERVEAQNLTLLTQMNLLTTTMEEAARRQANVLRAVQSGGILFALINFCLILFHFIRELRAADERTDTAREETDEILQTVADGLFLVDRDQRIGSQYSYALKTLLDVDTPTGKTITELLQGRLMQNDLKVAADYIALLFEPHVNERLASSLNPLQEVPIKGSQNPEMQRYLSFQFKRVLVNGQLSHLLVTVNDITARIALARTQQYRNDGIGEYLGLLGVLNRTEPKVLHDCLKQSRQTLDNINQRLRNASRNGVDEVLIASMARALHTLKGEAACLELQSLQSSVHDAETELAKLRQHPGVSGDQCLPLLVKIEHIFTSIDEIERLIDHLNQLQTQWQTLPPNQNAAANNTIENNTIENNTVENSTVSAPPLAWNDVAALAQRVAQDQGKRIMLHWEPAALEQMPEAYWLWLKRVGVQLVRNAIVHGIESPDVRLRNGKTAVGTLRIQARREGKDAWVFSVKDDGRGLDVATIRDKALASGLITQKDAESYSSVQVLSLIFEPGFSTVTPDLNAGMGVGLDMVRTITRKLGGRLRVSTCKNGFCEISLVLPDTPKFSAEEKRHATFDRG